MKEGKENNKIFGNMKKETKKRIKKFILKRVLFPIICILVLGASVIVVIEGAVMAPIKAIGDGLSSVGNAISNIFKFDEETGDIQMQENVLNSIRNELENQAIDPDYAGFDETNGEKYIEKFMKTEAASTMPDTGDSDVKGIIKIMRVFPGAKATKDEKTGDKVYESKELEFVGKSKFEEMQRNADADILNKFSIKGDNILYAVRTSVEIDGKKDTSIEIREINYKSAITQYSMPYEFLQILYSISQNPNFADAVADLIKDSRIELTIQDCETTTTTKTTTTHREKYTGFVNYTYNMKLSNSVTGSTIEGIEGVDKNNAIANSTTISKPIEQLSEPIVEESTTVRVTNNPVIAITKADTWISYQTTAMEREDTNTDSDTTTEQPDGEVEKDYDVSVITNPTALDDNAEAHNEAKQQLNSEVQLIQVENHKDRQLVEQSVRIQENIKSTTYKNTPSKVKSQEEKFLSLLRTVDGKKGSKYDPNGELVEYELPGYNEQNASAKKRKSSPDTSLRSAAEEMFSLLQRCGEKTAKLEEIMRYLMYKYTGINYGVTELDFSAFEITSFSSFSGGGSILEEYLKGWENESIRQYIAGETSYNSYIGQYVTQDKKNYICYTDLHDTRNYGYGVCHWLGPGWNQVERYSKLGINIKDDKYNQLGVSLLPIETVDQVMEMEIADNQAYVEKKVNAAGIKLEENQIHALVAVAYQYGNIGNFTTAYQQCGNTEALRDNFIVNGFTPFRSGYNNTKRATANWNVFNKGVYMTGGGKILDPAQFGSSDFLKTAEKVWKEVSTSGRYPTYGGSSVPCKGPTIDCSSFVSWVLYEYGYKEFAGAQHVTQQFYNTNWNAKYGWTEIAVGRGENPSSKFKPGDIFVRDSGNNDGHVQIVVSVQNGKVMTYDCGDPTAKTWNNSGGNPVDGTWFSNDSLARPGKIIRVTKPK